MSRYLSDARNLRFEKSVATVPELVAHLRRCDGSFVPRLSERVDIQAYATKIHQRAVTFEARLDEAIVALVAAYLDDPARAEGFITNVSVEPQVRGRGLAKTLMALCIEDAGDRGFERIRLEVGTANSVAIALYEQLGFEEAGRDAGFLVMTLAIGGRNS